MNEEDDQEIPTEEQIEKEEDRLEELQKAQKNLFLVIFQVTLYLPVISCVLCELLAACKCSSF